MVNMVNTWAPILYVIPEQGSGDEKTKRRYFFQTKRQGKMMSLTLDFEKLRELDEAPEIDPLNPSKELDCIIIDDKRIHTATRQSLVAMLDYNQMARPWKCGNRAGLIYSFHANDSYTEMRLFVIEVKSASEMYLVYEKEYVWNETERTIRDFESKAEEKIERYLGAKYSHLTQAVRRHLDDMCAKFSIAKECQ